MVVKNVVVTLGAKDAYYSNRIGDGGYVEAEKDVTVVDATGAGHHPLWYAPCHSIRYWKPIAEPGLQ
jgi:pfkB family carbohydrate kinase